VQNSGRLFAKPNQEFVATSNPKGANHGLGPHALAGISPPSRHAIIHVPHEEVLQNIGGIDPFPRTTSGMSQTSNRGPRAFSALPHSSRTHQTSERGLLVPANLFLAVSKRLRSGRDVRKPPDREGRIESLLPWLRRARSFQGWDFSGIRSRDLEPGPPWDYAALVSGRAKGRRRALDLGTGGGERLADLRPALPRRLVATEEWSRNAPVAFQRLRPLGVPVIRCRSVRLPFSDSTFDLVIDRHEEFSPREVSRVLGAGGEFITQQVGQSEWRELRSFFPRMTDFGDLHSMYSQEFERMGFRVESAEHHYRVAYPSLGEIVFMLGVAPWTVPDFDLTGDLDSLLEFEALSSTADGLVVTESRFLMIARKPG